MTRSAIPFTTQSKYAGVSELTSMSGAGFMKSIAYGTPDRPLDRVHVVPEGHHQRQRVADDPLPELRGEVVLVRDIAAVHRVIGHWQHAVLAEAHAPHVLVPLDVLLGDHRQ